MLRPEVLNRFAIAPRLSPATTVYEKNVGWGVGVGRTNDGVGVGPAGVGIGLAVGVGLAPGWIRFVGSGTHATTIAAMSRTPVQCLAMRILAIMTRRVLMR